MLEREHCKNKCFPHCLGTLPAIQLEYAQAVYFNIYAYFITNVKFLLQVNILVHKSLNKKQLSLPNESDFPGVLKRCPIHKLEGHENRINHVVWQPIVKSLASSYVL